MTSAEQSINVPARAAPAAPEVFTFRQRMIEANID